MDSSRIAQQHTRVGVAGTVMEQRESCQELVKCVLVGDTAVGKTRLICAQIRSAPTSLRQLLTTHVPTVWAIDQYRMYKEVMERSMTVVDGVQVSLRLWDTFGDHEKDRKFAYGRSDVILLCFSIGSRSSLIHCKTMWYPEIRRFCPFTPVILVGCKNDLRFLIKDPAYLEFCRDRSPFIRPIREVDLVMPEQARAVAKELGILYYETSIYTYYGATEVFENGIRAALIARRNQRFWMTNLKQIRPPLLQEPYCPPKHEYTNIEVFPGDFQNDLKKMLTQLYFPDLVFIIGGDEILAHRFVVAAGASKLTENLCFEKYSGCRRVSDISFESESSGDETRCLLGADTKHELNGCVNDLFTDNTQFDVEYNEFWSLVERASLRETKDDLRNVQLVLEMSEVISRKALEGLLHFIYTGNLNPGFAMDELIELARLLDSPQLAQNVQRTEAEDQSECEKLKPKLESPDSYVDYLKTELWGKCVREEFTDVTFQLEDGVVPAHRSILMARSDVMKAMFSQDFLERRVHVVTLPGVKTETFKYFLKFIYTDSIGSLICIETGILLIELANRLCLPRLVNLLEKAMVQELLQKSQCTDVTNEFVKILEPAQWYNATQISDWCLNQLASNFSKFSVHSKLFKELSSENRQRILQNRWPPVWYIKEFDYYQRNLEEERCKVESMQKKARKRNNSGCLLCFTTKSRKNEYSEIKCKNQGRDTSN